MHYEKSRSSKPHYPTIKTQKKLIYNYYVIILGYYNHCATIPLEIQCINK